MRSLGRSRLPLAIVVAVAAAATATFLLRPRSGLIEPATVDVKGYFTAFQLDRADPIVHQVHALVRLPRGEDVLPDRLPRGRVV